MYQDLLVKQLKTIFPREQTHVNSKKQLNVKYTGSGAYLELDVWLPNLNICFEFQDAYHYVTTWYAQKSKSYIETLDSEKEYLVRQKGIDLIIVPCWWNGTEDSLKSTIYFHRPDLFEEIPDDNIPLNPPRNFFEVGAVPIFGELMLASFPTDPFFIDTFVPLNWWMGEKYDGVRFFWNCAHPASYTRTGKEICLPPKIMEVLPPLFVDGEFWFGRGQYSTSGALLYESNSVLWDAIRMIGFDVPPKIGPSSIVFERRYSMLLRYITATNPMLIVASRVLCKDNVHLNAWVQNIVEEGGEGTILRQVKSPYVSGRSSMLLKIKSFTGDKEGIVVEVSEKFATLELPNGAVFQVPSEDIHISRINVGDIVSFSYESYGRRLVPVNPKIFRIRTDLSWPEICRNYVGEKTYINESHKEMASSNMRIYLEHLATTSGKDPSHPETWYNFPYENILPFKNVINQFKGYPSAIQSLFPDIQFDINLFQRSSWAPIENRRKFFENYADSVGFNSLDPSMWYAQPIEKIMSFKIGSR